MKQFKLSIFIIIIVGITNTNAQTVFSNFGREVKSGLKYFVKTFSQDRFQIKSTLGVVMTLHKGTSSGNAKVSIGQNELPFSTADYKLYVEDGILSESVKVANPTSWSDFVFDNTYSLRSLEDVETFIKINHHLPDVPSERQIIEQGYYDQHEINKVLLQKIEELTLYIIELQKEIEVLKSTKKTINTKTKVYES